MTDDHLYLAILEDLARGDHAAAKDRIRALRRKLRDAPMDAAPTPEPAFVPPRDGVEITVECDFEAAGRHFVAFDRRDFELLTKHVMYPFKGISGFWRAATSHPEVYPDYLTALRATIAEARRREIVEGMGEVSPNS